MHIHIPVECFGVLQGGEGRSDGDLDRKRGKNETKLRRTLRDIRKVECFKAMFVLRILSFFLKVYVFGPKAYQFCFEASTGGLLWRIRLGVRMERE